MIDSVAIWKYATIFGTLIAAGFGFPIPEEIPIVTAGAFVGHDSQDSQLPQHVAAVTGSVVVPLIPPTEGGTKWYIMLPLCILGVVLGDCVLFFVGRWFGPRLLNKAWVQKRILPPEKRAKIEANFEKRGVMILLAARLTPGIRTPVFVMAGVLRMPVSRFLLADALYAIPGVNLLFWLSYWFTDAFVEAVKSVDRHRPIAVAAVLAAVSGIILWKVFSNRKISTGNMDDVSKLLKPVGAVTQALESSIEKTVGATAAATAKIVDKVTHPMGHHPHNPPIPPPTDKPS
jgi:membrane protein DedA with SNARE-associated domain